MNEAAVVSSRQPPPVIKVAVCTGGTCKLHALQLDWDGNQQLPDTGGKSYIKAEMSR